MISRFIETGILVLIANEQYCSLKTLSNNCCNISIGKTVLSKKCILVNNDNQALVHVINKRLRFFSWFALVRQFVASFLEFYIYFKAKHLTSKENILKIWFLVQVQQFLQLASWAEKQLFKSPSIPPYSNWPRLWTNPWIPVWPRQLH